MDLSGPSARAAFRRAVLALMLWLVFRVDSSAQQPFAPLPPAATAGGAQPFLGRTELPAISQQDAFEIPPVVERPLGLDEGPTVRVAGFRMEGAFERPEHDVSLADVEAILSRHQEGQPEHGFTINQLQAVADEVTLHYRSHGLILAQAFVPAQDVQGGVVTLQLIEGTLGGIEVEGNTLYDTEVVKLPFTQLLGRPIAEASIEEALLTLQEFPGLTVFGTFREGARLGETELLVRVREENRTTFTPMIDNYGSEFTGEGRIGLQFDVNNPFGAADRISGYVLKTVEPANGTYGGVNYSKRIGSRARSTVGFGVSRNTFDVTDVSTDIDLGLHGVVDQANVFWQQSFAQRRTFRASGTLGLAYKQAVTKQPGVDPTDELLGLSYTYDFYAVGRERRGMNLGYFRITGGDNDGERVSRTGGTGSTAAGSFGKLAFSFQRLQRFGDHHALLLRLDGQQSNDLLASLEQFAIGGPANVRAYPISEALVDTGGSASLEWIMDAPGFADRALGNSTWGEVLQVSLYADYAGGEVNDPFPMQESDVNFRGYGVGLQLSLANRFSLRLDVATPDGEREASNGRDPQTYLSFSMSF